MERVCFISRVDPGQVAGYRQRHAEVWPEMRAALTAAGWANYSLYLSGDGLLVGYLETGDYQAALDRMANAPVNARWQAEMAEFFAGGSGRRPDEEFIRLEEVFHLD